MRTQLKYLNGIEFLHDKLIEDRITFFFDDRTDDATITTPTSGSTVYILGIVLQNTDAIGGNETTARIAIRLKSPTEDTGEQEIERITLQPRQIAVRYYPSLRIVGNNTRTFHIESDREDLSISSWFYTINTTNEEDSNIES